MTRVPPEPSSSRILDAIVELRFEHVARPTKLDLDRGLHSLRARAAHQRARGRLIVRSAVYGSAALLVLVGTIRFTMAYRHVAHADPALTYVIDGGSVLEGGYLRESAHNGVALTFSEGTKVQLLPGTRGRLRSVDKDGARLAIENGTASLHVTKSEHRHWLVEVGPFLVSVKGTVFTVSWDPSNERFELKLREGRVVVSGPVSGGDLTLRSGQRLLVNLSKAETVITEDLTSAANGTTDAAAPDTSADTSVASAVDAAESATTRRARGAAGEAAISASANPSNERRWADDLAKGNWNRILDDVERAGVDVTLNRASSEDLSTVASAARYRQRHELARAALLAQLRRFPNSQRAIDAIYLLGRVEEARPSGSAQAITWYDVYLSRAPRGAYAAEALGRKLTLVHQTGGVAQAQPIAEEYLRRFPTGSYAGAARALLGAH
jgi:TolA-binding protein